MSQLFNVCAKNHSERTLSRTLLCQLFRSLMIGILMQPDETILGILGLKLVILIVTCLLHAANDTGSTGSNDNYAEKSQRHGWQKRKI